METWEPSQRKRIQISVKHMFIRNENASYMFRPVRSLPQAVHDCIKRKCITTLLTSSSVVEVKNVWNCTSFPPYVFIISLRPSCTAVTHVCRHSCTYIGVCIANSYIHANEKSLIGRPSSVRSQCCKRYIETRWTASSRNLLCLLIYTLHLL